MNICPPNLQTKEQAAEQKKRLTKGVGPGKLNGEWGPVNGRERLAMLNEDYIASMRISEQKAKDKANAVKYTYFKRNSSHI